MEQAEINITNTSMADELHATLLKRQAEDLYAALKKTMKDLRKDKRRKGLQDLRGLHWEDLLNHANDLNAVLQILSLYEPNKNWHRGPDELDGGDLVAIITDKKTKKSKKNTPKDRALDRIGGRKKKK